MAYLTIGELKKLDTLRKRMENRLESGEDLMQIKKDASNWAHANKNRRVQRRAALRTIRGMYSWTKE
jgi:hypothetical protein